MKENSKKLWSNFKYWLLGSLIIFNIGCITTIIFMADFYYCLINDKVLLDFGAGRILFYRIYIYPLPFLTGLILKLLKRDLPVYFYGTIGIIYLFLENSCFDIINRYVARIAYGDDYWGVIGLREGFTFEDYLPIIFAYLLCPLLGGGIIDLYRYIKSRYSKTSPYCN